MSAQSFRFVHAADFHLEEAASDLTDVPDQLSGSLIEAPYKAAERVIDATISERAEFLLLSGDLLHPMLAGPRAISFLVDQFQRLAERDIAVYWATGRVDASSNWPAAVAFPENVHLFSEERVEELSHFRNEYALATILGRSGAGKLRSSTTEYQGDPNGPFQIGVACGEADSEALAHRNVDYWALGGNHQHTVLLSTPCRAEHPGSPQGRSLLEGGPHGCILGQVDDVGQLRTQLLATDVVRWRREMVAAGDAPTPEQLRRVLRSRMQEIANHAGQPCLVSWSIQSDIHTPALHSALAEELTGWLREQFGNGSPSVWTVRVDVRPPSSFPEDWYEEDSILGDFLRAVREQQTGRPAPIDLSSFATSSQAAGELSPAMRLDSESARTRLMAEAAMLGVDLLRGDISLHNGDGTCPRPNKEEIPA